ncbi:MAG: acyl--CoA ligase [Chloroflexi bacterium]|uniref:Acyl--CoA ligase n=1 Tax=Candidatus Chlorohelix allophototropha TaxID=3003348 RepID=A0A8T7MAH7_9CHLR|nr:acyl--CoA ligase [Chloroflexota bacterium]WJW68954.1 acyl--CoA ligase [Chloroflexota bacterium L227-S17]
MNNAIPLDDLVRRMADREASRTALVWRDQTTSYLTLDARIDRVAYGLLRMGVTAGSRVVLYMHNIPQFIESYMAITRIGALVVPINVLHEGRDLEYLLANCGAVGIITIAPYYPRIKEVRNTLVRLKWVVSIRGNAPQPPNTIAWEDLIGEALPGRLDSFAEPDDIALLAYTSGTSGPPKGVLHTHNSLLTNCRQFSTMQQVDFGNIGPDVVLLPIPLFNLYGLNIGLNHTLMMGGMLVLMERFDAIHALELIQTHACTVIHGTPSIFRDLVNSPDLSQVDLTSLRYAFCYGAALSDEVASAFLRRTRLQILECYGLTEASPVVACAATSNNFRPGSVGQPLPGVKVRMVDANDNDLRPGTIGEVVVSGANLMQDYFNLRKFEAAYNSASSEESPVSSDAPLWLHTGDMGWMDPDFNLYLIDRREDMMFIDGEMVFPREIEEALIQHPAVAEAAAIPVRLPGTEPHFQAVVVLDSYQQNVRENELIEYLRNSLPAKHMPQRIYLADYLPRLVNGRIMRRAIRLGS